MDRSGYRNAYPVIIHIDNRGKYITGQLELSLTNSKRAECHGEVEGTCSVGGGKGGRIRVCAQQKLHQKHRRCMTRGFHLSDFRVALLLNILSQACSWLMNFRSRVQFVECAQSTFQFSGREWEEEGEGLISSP